MRSWPEQTQVKAQEKNLTLERLSITTHHVACWLWPWPFSYVFAVGDLVVVNAVVELDGNGIAIGTLAHTDQERALILVV